MWDVIMQFMTTPAFELTIHAMIAAVFFMEFFHAVKHRIKNKRSREEPRYTLDEARVILFDEALAKSPPRPEAEEGYAYA